MFLTKVLYGLKGNNDKTITHNNKQ